MTALSVTVYNDLRIGDEAVAYDGNTGEVSLGGKTVEGHLVLELAHRLTNAMRRDGHITAPGAETRFVGTHLDQDKIEQIAKGLQWANILNAYPVEHRERLKELLLESRENIERQLLEQAQAPA